MDQRPWQAYGQVLRAVHASQPPPERAAMLARESLTPLWAERVRAVDQRLAGGRFAGRVEAAFAHAWHSGRAGIGKLLSRLAALAEQIRPSPPPFVLCHADIHTWNLMIDAQGGLSVVDWDEVKLAPKERDLLVVMGGIGAGSVSEQQQRGFFQGYGGGDTTSDTLPTIAMSEC